MKTIQRIYTYLVWVVSLEVVVWATIDLGRTFVTTVDAEKRLDDLARSSAFLLVGLLVFLLHAWMARRRAAADDEERFSRTRATILYGASLGLWIPAVQNLMAVLERLIAPWLKVDPQRISIGGYQTWPENLIAILVNVLAAWLVHRMLRADWQAQPKGDSYSEMRRAWRYLWLVYSVIITYIGLIQLLSYLLWLVGSRKYESGSALVDGLIMLPVGIALWAAWWRFIQGTLEDPAEARSTLRLVVLYLFTFIFAVVAIFAAIIFLEQAILGWMTALKGKAFLDSIDGPLSGVLPAAAVWLFFSSVLRREVEAEPDIPRRAAMRRLYIYALSLLGLGITVAGVLILAEPLAQVTLGRFALWRANTKETLSNGLACLLVGLPLWLRQWLPARSEANIQDEAGEHARRSTTRKVYLYFSLFAGVLGVMGTAGGLVFYLFRSLLGIPLKEHDLTVVILAIAFVVFGWLLGYHWRVLQADRKQATGQFTKLQSAFQVVVFEPGDGYFSAQVSEALRNEAPDIQVVVHPADSSPGKELAQAGAVVLPSSLAVNQTGRLGKWLEKYSGTRLVVPDETPGWVWVGLSEGNLEPLSKYAAKLAARLAEGQEVKSARFRYIWIVMGYLFALQLAVTLLFFLFAIAMSIVDLVA